MSTESRLSPRAGAGVFLVALALRVIHLLGFSRLVYYETPFGDARAFVDAAADIVRRGPWGGVEPYFQGPLYPLALSLVHVVGLPPQAMLWVQTVVGALTALGVAVVASRAFGSRAGTGAGLLYAAYDVAIFFDGDLLAASLATSFSVWGLAGALRLASGPGSVRLGIPTSDFPPSSWPAFSSPASVAPRNPGWWSARRRCARFSSPLPSGLRSPCSETW